MESRLGTPEVQVFAVLLSRANSWQDIRLAKRVLTADSYGIDAVVSLPFHDPEDLCTPVTLPHNLTSDYITEYFCHPYKFFIKHELTEQRCLHIDYSVTFDTNSASYVNLFVQGGSFGAQDATVKGVFDNMLYGDINFDASFYFAENIKQLHPLIMKARAVGGGPEELWSSLNEKFRQNIINLTLFRGIDNQHYQKTHDLKFDISIDEATRRSIDFVYEFYQSPVNEELIEYLRTFQMIILLHLLAALKIQHSSNEGPKKKLHKLLASLQQEGAYFERETVIAYQYFKNRSSIPILNTVNKGGNQSGLMDKLDSLAWDMTLPRYMELLTSVNAPGDFMLPLSLTFDQNLLKLLRCFPTKAVVIDRSTGSVLSLPMLSTKEFFDNEGCGDILSSFMSEENRRERREMNASSINAMEDRIKAEYDSLRLILDS